MPHPSPVERAQAEQRLASDPQVSAFVRAHAGAGKTKLLIDRLLRLMLGGAAPGQILCLTFTKAAAAEMAIRLQRALGRFVTMDDASLDESLRLLTIRPDAEARLRARRLFADVLDLPGGMRIETIHGFCQSLLRRFPLEAGVSPHFQLAEEAAAAPALLEAQEEKLPEAPPALIAAIAGLANAGEFARLVARLEEKRAQLAPLLAMAPAARLAALRRAAGAPDASEAEILARAVNLPPPAFDALKRASSEIRQNGSETAKEFAADMTGWLNLAPAERVRAWKLWAGTLLTQAGKPRTLSHLARKELLKVHPFIGEVIEAEQQRLLAITADLEAARCAAATDALLGLAAPILGLYAGQRERHGMLDYDDLITRSLGLLSGGGGAWVKYKLDAGIAHILLDEVQDTAPEQWQVAAELSGDFFAGDSSHAGPRSIFAVGDIKQSIYSFQGAEPAEFERWRTRYAEQVRTSGAAWHDATLDVSFRSTAAVLAVVDATFAQKEAADGVCELGSLTHVPNRAGDAGSVTLWPPAPRPLHAEPEPWRLPAENQPARSAADDLVQRLADWIAQATRGGMQLESEGRALRAGDVLVLVRKRRGLARALVRALKARGVAVAGLDRMVLTQQPAVRDLMSLAEALLLPGDDLSLAEFLVSPLGGLTDARLQDLAAGRPGKLWDTLRSRATEAPDWQAASDLFATLLGRVDYASPHALLAEILGPLGGRAKFYARLGPEAGEPLDELLAASLRYAQTETPSLQGFLHWLRQSGAEVKREAETAGDAVRVMTVHGAKGLEAPLVILPDATLAGKPDEKLFWTHDPATGLACCLWQPNRESGCAAVAALRESKQQAEMAEYNRLLYVALTRARDHLLVCGWESGKPIGGQEGGHWHAKVAAGLRAAGARALPDPWGEALQLACPQTAPPRAGSATQAGIATSLPPWAGAAPDWVASPLPPEPALPRPLAPSRPEGVELGQVPAASSPLARDPSLAARGRGVMAHALLQHLPSLPVAEQEQAALRYCGPEMEDLARSVLAVLRAPELGPLFGPGSRAEQRLAGVVGQHVLSGQVDRLAVLGDRVLIADYKTARMPPAEVEKVPVLYLRQMAAYRALLRALSPAHRVQCLLIWTEGVRVMVLPDALLDAHAPGQVGAPEPAVIAG